MRIMRIATRFSARTKVRRPMRGFITAVVLGLVALSGSLIAEPSAAKKKNSWASFRNGHEQRGVADQPLPKKLELLWKHEAGETITATAAIAEGRVYVGTLKGEVLCLDLKNGERLWTYHSVEIVDENTFAPGFLAAATVTADSVYIGDEDGVFHAISRSDGKERWKFTTDAQVAGGAAVVGKNVIFGSHDGKLYCVNTTNGNEVWSVATADRVNCSVAVVGNYTFTSGCDGLLRVIDITTGQENEKLQQQLGSHVIASPAVMGDLLYVGNYDGDFLAIDWKHGERVWTYQGSRGQKEYDSSAAVTDDVVVVGNDDKRLHCLDRKTGKARWTFPTGSAIDGSPVIAGDRVFFGSGDGKLYGANLADGKEVFRFVSGRPFSASPAVAEGHLVIGSESSKGYIYCFGAK